MSKKALGETEGSGMDVGRVVMSPSSQSRQHGTGTTEMALVRPRQQRQDGRVFECRTCGRRFPTYQALGGHRASHGRPAPPRPRARTPGVGVGDDGSACARPCRLGMQADTVRTNRVHGCPVCGVEFPVGQALGGHMKRHRAMGDGDASAHWHAPGQAMSLEAEAMPVEAGSAGEGCTGEICLDLNLSQPGNCAKCRNATLGAAAKRSLLVFSD